MHILRLKISRSFNSPQCSIYFNFTPQKKNRRHPPGGRWRARSEFGASGQGQGARVESLSAAEASDDEKIRKTVSSVSSWERGEKKWNRGDLA